MRPTVNVEKTIQCQTPKALEPRSPCSSGTGKVKSEGTSPIKEVRNSVSVSAENPSSIEKMEDRDRRNSLFTTNPRSLLNEKEGMTAPRCG